MKILDKPSLIQFEKVGSPELGFITVAENKNLPFQVKRIYWTYHTPDDVIRGHHAHYDLEQIIFSVNGLIEFEVENIIGEKQLFILNNPNIGLYIPKLYWRTIKFKQNAVLLCLASHEYNENDYIRDYAKFCELKYSI